eukprot:scaffold75885_cov64-Phaeocystis_antarctica.AAC.2
MAASGKAGITWLALEPTLRTAIKEGDERRLCELLRLLQMGERPLQVVLALKRDPNPNPNPRDIGGISGI